MSNHKGVTKADLDGLFKDLVENLSTVIRDGSATGKDKELAVKLLDMHAVGLDTSIEPEHLEALDSPLPFDELHPN